MFNEKCLVVKRVLLEKEGFLEGIPKKNGIYYGLRKLDDASRLLSFIDTQKEFRDRYGSDGVEEDPSWQQIIFYQVIIVGNKFFAYRRTEKDSKYPEKRLFGKVSVGVGGHVMEMDEDIEDSLYRELSEEVEIYRSKMRLTTKKHMTKKDLNIRPIALLKDDTNAVAKIHLGIICKTTIPGSYVAIRIKEDSENTLGKLVTLAEYYEWLKRDNLIAETWAEIVVQELLMSLK